MMSKWRRSLAAAAVGLSCAGTVAAQDAVQTERTDPLQCWWRTSAGAVRVGEPFTAVLTCAVLETEDVKVVVDESRLEPSVVQFAPFETLGGSHAVDLRNGARRFFQYEYRLRLIAENLFGKDVGLPETKLTYRIQSRVGPRRAGAPGASAGPGSTEEAIAGRDQTYVLPPMSIRLLSLVPADASDIRDASSETFADLDQRTFRANLFTVVGGVLFALAGLVGLLTVIRLVVRARPATGVDRLVGDGAVLRGVGRELSAVQRERETRGWSADLAARALAALRILGTYAIGRTPSRVALNGRPSTADDGRLIVTKRWPRGKQIAVSGSVTQRSIGSAIAQPTNGRRPGELESLGDALERFTVAEYGRGEKLDDGALDESLAAGRQLLKRLQVEQIWIVRRLRGRKAAEKGESRVWSR
jgi:hypothetical protein